MEKVDDGDTGGVKEYLSSFAEIAECLDKLTVPVNGLEVIVKVSEVVHNEIQEEISKIGRLNVEKNNTFTVNISGSKFTFIK